MSNRFTDDQKWSDPWFCALTPAYKLFWNYICDNCNHAGIWKVNWALVKFHIWEEKIDPKIFGNRVVVLNEEKWFIKGYVLFQQKINSIDELNPDNNAHRSILRILESEKIINISSEKIEGLARGLVGAREGLVSPPGKVKVKVNNKKIFKAPSLDEVIEYCRSRNSPVDPKVFYSTYESTGWIKANGAQVQNWKATIITWELKDKSKQSNKYAEL